MEYSTGEDNTIQSANTKYDTLLCSSINIIGHSSRVVNVNTRMEWHDLGGGVNLKKMHSTSIKSNVAWFCVIYCIVLQALKEINCQYSTVQNKT